MANKRNNRPPTTNLDRLLPIDDDFEEVTLGYPDLSGGRITEELKQLSLAELRTVHRYAELGRIGFIPHIDWLIGLANGLHKVDPDRKSKEAVSLAEEQVEGSRDHFRLIETKDFIPYVVATRGPQDLSDDAHGMGWYIYPTMADREIWLADHGDDLDNITGFLRDPEKEDDYIKAMTDIGMKYHKLTHPGPRIIILTGEEQIELRLDSDWGQVE
jgi:hypothetical protein